MKCHRCETPIRIRPNVKFCDTCRPIVKAEQNACRSVQIEANRLERLRVKWVLWHVHEVRMYPMAISRPLEEKAPIN